MKKIYLIVIIILIVSLSLSACKGTGNASETTSHPQQQEQEIEQEPLNLLPVAENLCIKYGEDPEAETLLESADFVGFDYSLDESHEGTLNIYFYLTSEGQIKMEKATENAKETFSCLPVWIDDELISSPMVNAPIKGNEFVLTFSDINKDKVESIINQLQGI